MKEVIIFDDFYSNPYDVRDAALKSEYKDVEGFPGQLSSDSLNDPKILEFFCYLAGEKVTPIPGISNGNFATQYGTLNHKHLIHIDLPSLETTWSAVCFLTLPKDYTNEDGTFADAGINFWKHKRTKMEKLPRDVTYLESIGLYTPKHLYDFIDEEGQDESLWIKTMSVPIKFNRLVLFRSNLWYSHAGALGDNLENSRLYQNFFFEHPES